MLGAIGMDENYVVRDTPRVQRFLGSYPYLLPVVEEAPVHIARHFPNAPVSLEVETDPESGPQDEQLVMLIGTTSTAESDLASLKHFDNDWWLDRVAETQGKLVINIEFR